MNERLRVSSWSPPARGRSTAVARTHFFPRLLPSSTATGFGLRNRAHTISESRSDPVWSRITQLGSSTRASRLVDYGRERLCTPWMLRVLSVSLREDGERNYFWKNHPGFGGRKCARRRASERSPLWRRQRDVISGSRSRARLLLAGPDDLPFCRAWANPARVRSPRIFRSNASKMASSPPSRDLQA